MSLPSTILEQIRNLAADPGQPALSGGPAGSAALSYAELATAVATGAERLGRPQTVILLAGRAPVTAAWMLAGLAAGCLVLPLDPRQGAARLTGILSRVTDPLILHDRAGQAVLNRGRPATMLRSAALDTQSLPAPVRTQPFAPALVLATSGSTGVSKLVPIPEAELIARAEGERAWFSLTARDRTLGLLPWSFDVGLAQLFSTLWTGGRHHIVSSWLPADIAGAARATRATGMAATPAVWTGLLALDPEAEVWAALKGLRYATLSGGDLGAEAVLEIDRRLGPGRLHKTYGQTEFFRISALKPDQIRTAPGSVGGPYHGSRIAILDDHGDPVPAGQVGQVVAWGAGRMAGYLGEPQETAHDRPHRTGDMGLIDAAGFLHLRGRRDTMIKRMDQRMHLEELDAHARTANDGAPAAYLAPEDGPLAGQLVVVFEGESSAEREAELRSRLRRALPAHFCPQMCFWRAKLPVTATGKLDRQDLAQALAELSRKLP